MKLRLTDRFGERCITVEDGHRLYAALHASFKGGEEVVIDLTGVRTLFSQFLNNSIGLLFRDFKPEAVGRLLRLENATHAQQETIERVMINAKAHYHEPLRRKIADDALAKIVEEMD